MSYQAIENLDVDDFWTKGYAVLPGVYSREEIQSFREGAYATKDEGGDILANDRLNSILTDGRMISVARKLLGTNTVYYGGDATFTINGTQRGFHKDNTDRQDPNGPDWTQGRYTQLRFGIYCQDHTKHTGGLNLREGSHEWVDHKKGPNRYVKVKPGDLAVWSMRITHSGNGLLLRWPWHNEVPLPTEHDKYPNWKKAKPDGDRIAIFAHLGADDAHAKRYNDYLKTRAYMVNRWRKKPYTPEQLDKAEAAGLKVRNMPAEVMDDPKAGLSAKWEPFPY